MTIQSKWDSVGPSLLGKPDCKFVNPFTSLECSPTHFRGAQHLLTVFSVLHGGNTVMEIMGTLE
jgi:hypothetical protein